MCLLPKLFLLNTTPHIFSIQYFCIMTYHLLCQNRATHFNEILRLTDTKASIKVWVTPGLFGEAGFGNIGLESSFDVTFSSVVFGDLVVEFGIAGIVVSAALVEDSFEATVNNVCDVVL